MGQSNMAGRGIVNDAHPETADVITDGAGFEFRAVSNPTCLYKMAEPFGVNENKIGGINDGANKTGSMVTAFTNAYYAGNGNVPVVGVSASKGGSNSSQWLTTSSEGYLADSVDRMTKAVEFLENHNYEIRHKYMVWCQGESDAEVGNSAEVYKANTSAILDEMFAHGIEKCFMIRIGNCNIAGSYDKYVYIQNVQDEMAQSDDRIVMVSHLLSTFLDRGLMKDGYHFFQSAYNEAGADAGAKMAEYVMNGTIPSFDD